MITPAHIAEPSPRPDPQHVRHVAHARTRGVLGLVRALIIFGKTLAIAVRGYPSGETGLTIGSRFGTRNVALILARISRGLRLAAALEAALAGRADQLDGPWNAGPSPLPRSAPASAPRSRATQPPAAPQDSTLADLPTSRELARQFRNRPVHAVLDDIAFDLGLDRSDPLWQEVADVITALRRGFPVVVAKIRSRRACFVHSVLPDIRLAWPNLPQPSQWLPAAWDAKPTSGPPWPSAQLRKA